MLGTQQIRPYKWKPGTNTVAYFPFTDDLLDHSGNSNTLTVGGSSSKSTIGYSFSLSNGGVVFANGGNVKFVSEWANITSTGSPNGQLNRLYGGYCIYFPRNTVGTASKRFVVHTTSSSTTYISSNQTSISTGTWHHYALGFDGSNTYGYLDGQLFWTGNGIPYKIGNEAGFAYGRGGSGTGVFILSDCIAETAVWTSQQVSDYYNATKSNYGL